MKIMKKQEYKCTKCNKNTREEKSDWNKELYPYMEVCICKHVRYKRMNRQQEEQYYGGEEVTGTVGYNAGLELFKAKAALKASGYNKEVWKILLPILGDWDPKKDPLP